MQLGLRSPAFFECLDAAVNGKISAKTAEMMTKLYFCLLYTSNNPRHRFGMHIVQSHDNLPFKAYDRKSLAPSRCEHFVSSQNLIASLPKDTKSLLPQGLSKCHIFADFSVIKEIFIIKRKSDCVTINHAAAQHALLAF